MPVQYVIRRLRFFFVFRVLHVDDTPHRIALGVALGVFIAWTPTVGFQMVLTLLAATLLGANKLVGLPFTWISNIVTAPAIYFWCNYNIGMKFLGGNYPAPDFEWPAGGSWWFEVWVNRVQEFWEATWQAFLPIWLGSLVMGVVLGLVSYGAVHWAVVHYRSLRQHRREKRSKRIGQPAPTAVESESADAVE